MSSVLEEAMALHIRAAKLPAPEREFRFAPRRRWRFDFAWPERMLALEIEGIGMRKPKEGQDGRFGRHQTPQGMTDDCVKYAEAMLLGWRVLRVTGAMVRDGRALQLVERAIGD